MVPQQVYLLLRGAVLTSVVLFLTTGSVDAWFIQSIRDSGCVLTSSTPLPDRSTVIEYTWSCYAFSLACRDHFFLQEGKLGYRMSCGGHSRPGVGGV